MRLLALVLGIAMIAGLLAYRRFRLRRPSVMVRSEVDADDPPPQRARDSPSGYSRRIWRSDLTTLLCAVTGIGALTCVIAVLSWIGNIGIDVDEDTALATVAQVIPATIVAVFIAVLGLGFIVAQLVAPTRGSRAVTMQHESRRLRAIVIIGLVLLVVSLFLSTASKDAVWQIPTATALIIATGIYLVGATAAISALLTETIDPKRFSDEIVEGARRCRGRHGNDPQFVSDDLYERVRIFRGWLRTVNQIGESRDLQHAIEGTEKLVDVYIETLRSYPRLALVRETSPRATAPAVRGARDTPRDCHRSGGCSRWFADELGRALVRAVESGISGGTLPRDLFRILDLFARCIMKFARLGNPSGRHEARVSSREVGRGRPARATGLR